MPCHAETARISPAPATGPVPDATPRPEAKTAALDGDGHAGRDLGRPVVGGQRHGCRSGWLPGWRGATPGAVVGAADAGVSSLSVANIDSSVAYTTCAICSVSIALESFFGSVRVMGAAERPRADLERS